MASDFRETIVFLNDLGLYDVVLPFLLVFTVTFALLDKTKVLGEEKVDGQEGGYPKKHLNSLAAFVIAFFVVASSKLVETIMQISSQIVILLLGGFFFLLLAGSIVTSSKNDTPYFLSEGWPRNVGLGIMFIGLVFIFLNTLKTGSGSSEKTWLMAILDWFSRFSTDISVSAIVLVAIIVGFMFYVGRDSSGSSSPSPSAANGSGSGDGNGGLPGGGGL